jgi:hypothetical protein
MTSAAEAAMSRVVAEVRGLKREKNGCARVRDLKSHQNRVREGCASAPAEIQRTFLGVRLERRFTSVGARCAPVRAWGAGKWVRACAI